MKRAITSFNEYAILEKKSAKTGLKHLVGKKDDEELTEKDADRLGKMNANMDGEEKKKYVGIINFLGASCNIYNRLWKSYKRVRNTLEKKNG